jgi:hypothetical protein
MMLEGELEEVGVDGDWAAATVKWRTSWWQRATRDELLLVSCLPRKDYVMDADLLVIYV